AQGVDGRLLSFDISDRAQSADTLAADIAEHGMYWGVVLNAGISRDDAFPNLDGDDWDNVLRTNLDGFYNVLHPLVMPMVRTRNGGRIVAMTSVSGEIGNRGQVNYAASKAGIIGAAKALSLELAKRQITVNCVSPGAIETQMTDDLPLKELKSMIPMRRLGRAEEVAAMVSFLVSEQASYITRQVFAVNGGLA
ncbi:MAG: 3-oxoacyl-ACP reductase FabG, partial [Rhodospirillaceae bacterium]|nr:3-oxoacyl-ACP reductase FabG [Rhodospirillaceae bacterium]